MTREEATRKLERIIGVIENGRTPARVKELYVFGSYARGALNPGDLDLIVIHEWPQELLERLNAELRAKYGPHVYNWPTNVSAPWRFEAMMRQALRRPGEEMDIFLDTSLKKVLRYDNIAKSTRVMLWSENDRDWRAKLASIKPDSNAGRFERDHFADIKRFQGDLQAMEEVSEAIRQGMLRLTRIPLDEIKPDLNPLYQHWLDWWNECKVMGKESMKLLPYGMWWMQQQRGQKCRRPEIPEHDGTMCSEDRKYLICFGRPVTSMAFAVLGDGRIDGYRKVCLIPHIKKRKLNALYVFEQGPLYAPKRLRAIRESLRQRCAW